MAKFFLNLMKTINSQIQELQQPPKRTRKSPNHYRVKLLKNSDREILKQLVAGRLHRETEIGMKADFSSETMHIRGEWINIFKLQKERKLSTKKSKFR